MHSKVRQCTGTGGKCERSSLSAWSDVFDLRSQCPPLYSRPRGLPERGVASEVVRREGRKHATNAAKKGTSVSLPTLSSAHLLTSDLNLHQKMYPKQREVKSGQFVRKTQREKQIGRCFGKTGRDKEAQISFGCLCTGMCFARGQCGSGAP